MPLITNPSSGGSGHIADHQNLAAKLQTGGAIGNMSNPHWSGHISEHLAMHANINNFKAPNYFPITILRPSSPAAGSEVSITCTGNLWIVNTVKLVFTTSSAAANTRSMFLVMDDGTNEICRWTMQTTGAQQTASTTVNYYWGVQRQAAQPYTGSYGDSWGNLMPYLYKGYHLKTLTLNLDSADQYSGAVFQIAEY